MLLKEDVADDNSDVEEMDQEVDDAQEVPHDKDEDPTADVEGMVFPICSLTSTDLDAMKLKLANTRAHKFGYQKCRD